jgi:hypothetical protein
MNPLVLIAVMAIAPVVLLLLLRVNAAMVFLSLCLGSVLVQFVGRDAQSLVNLFSGTHAVNSYGVSLGLLLLPAVFTMLVMIATVRGKIALILNLLPALSVGLLALLLAEPLFSPGLRGTIGATSAWQQVERAQVLVVSLGAIISLLFLWLQRPKRAAHDKHKRGQH